MKNKKQVDPFVIFSFWMAFLFGVYPGMIFFFRTNYIQKEFVIIFITQSLYLVSVLLPLCVGIKRLRDVPEKFSGVIYVVATFFFVVFDLVAGISLVTAKGAP